MAELPFEYLLAGIESARGTALANPTHYLNLAGTLTPKRSRYRPEESRGTLARSYRSQTVRQWSEFSASGPLDVYTLPVLLNALVAGGVDGPGAQPANAVLTQLWEFVPTMDEDDLESLTLYWGDPNVQAFQATFCMVDELTISADGSGTDGVTMAISGQGRFPSKTAPGALPTMVQGPIHVPGAMQLWIDATTIATTAITGRVVSAEATIPLGASRKWLAAGPAAGADFTAIGRGKRQAQLKLVLELPDMTQYDQWAADTVLKTRIRFNGPSIETVGEPATTYYHYVEMDIYGPIDNLSWGEHEGTNRTAEMTILSEYDATAEHDFALRVQNDSDAL